MNKFYNRFLIAFVILIGSIILAPLAMASLAPNAIDPNTGYYVPVNASQDPAVVTPTNGSQDPATGNPTNGSQDPVAGNPTNGSQDPKSSGNIGLQNPLKVRTIGGLIQTAVEIFSYVVIIFAVLAFIWVGLQYILARGNSEKMKELSKWLGYIVIGVAVVIGARVIITIVINTLESTGVVDERVIQSARDARDGN